MGFPYDQLQRARLAGYRVKKRYSNKWKCTEYHVLLPQSEADRYQVRYVDASRMPLVESVPINVLTEDGFVCEISRIERAEDYEKEGIAYGVFAVATCRYNPALVGECKYEWRIGHIHNPDTRRWFEDDGFISESSKGRLLWSDPRISDFLELLLQTKDYSVAYTAVFGDTLNAVAKGKELLRRPEVKALMTEKLEDKLSEVLRDRGLDTDAKKWILDEYVEVIVDGETEAKDKIAALAKVSDMIGMLPKKEVVPMLPGFGIPMGEVSEMEQIAQAHKTKEITGGATFTVATEAEGSDEGRSGDDRPSMPSEDIQSELPEIPQ